jgi:hypothetical protein
VVSRELVSLDERDALRQRHLGVGGGVLGVPQRHLGGDQAEVLAEGAGLERQRLVRGAVRHPVDGVGQEVRLAAGESLAEVLDVAVRVDGANGALLRESQTTEVSIADSGGVVVYGEGLDADQGVVNARRVGGVRGHVDAVAGAVRGARADSLGGVAVVGGVAEADRSPEAAAATLARIATASTAAPVGKQVTRGSVFPAAAAGEGRGLDVQLRPALRLLRRDGGLLDGEVAHLAALLRLHVAQLDQAVVRLEELGEALFVPENEGEHVDVDARRRGKPVEMRVTGCQAMKVP